MEIKEVDIQAEAEEAIDPASTSEVKPNVPEVEIHLYRQGKGPIAVFKSNLVGWDQDQLEVRVILEKYGFKSVYAFSPESGRCAAVRFHRNGRSILTYRDGSVVHLDGEPKGLATIPSDIRVCFPNFNPICSEIGFEELNHWTGLLFIQDSIFNPLTRILVGVSVITVLIVLVQKDAPKWMQKYNFSMGSIPPWVLACAVIVFTRARKRTKDLFKRFSSK